MFSKIVTMNIKAGVGGGEKEKAEKKGEEGGGEVWMGEQGGARGKVIELAVTP